MISEMDQAKVGIVDTKRQLKLAEAKLVEAEGTGNEAKVAKYKDQMKNLRTLLAQQKELENFLFRASSENDQVSSADAVVSLLRDRLRDTDLVQSVAEVFTVYKMKGGQDRAGFGGKLRGLEGTQRAMAAEADKQSAIRSRNGVLTKDENSQVLCLWGVGTSKSRLLAAGLEAHKTYCADPALRAMLKDENRCLRILISFNTSTTYSAAESPNAEKLICRRLIKEVTGISWGKALKLNLGARLTVGHCIEAIVRYHREVRGLRSGEPVFVFLGVDDVHQIAAVPVLRSVEVVKDIMRLLRSLRTLPGIFVATLMAGTHAKDINESLLESGIRPVMLPFEPLSRTDVGHILTKDAGVCDEYMQSPHFQRVVDSALPVLRPLGELVSTLPVQYDASSVRQGQQVVGAYFASKAGTLEVAERDYLLLVALTGHIFMESDLGRKLFEGSTISLDDLQNRGILQMVPLDVGRHQVCLPLDRAEAWSKAFSGSAAVLTGARDLLESARKTTEDCSNFAQFTTCFFRMKMAALRRVDRTTFTMAMLLPSAHITADLADKLFRIPVRSHLVPPDDFICLDSEDNFPSDKPVANLYQFLVDGGLLVNAPGASVDIFAFLERNDAKRGQWEPSGLAVAAKKTTPGMVALGLSDVNSDRRKATKAYKQLQAPHNERSCTVIHFTDRELTAEDEDADAGGMTKLSYERKVELFLKKRRSSVTVDQKKIGRIVGPVLSRLLSLPGPARRTLLHPERGQSSVGGSAAVA